jgi:response regulator RpfG family c-di-GMP phosphodiesterase
LLSSYPLMEPCPLPQFMEVEKMLNYQDIVLIVDDEVTIMHLLHQKLAKEGYRCLEADTAKSPIRS